MFWKLGYFQKNFFKNFWYIYMERFIMRDLITRLLREALDKSAYRKWSRENRDVTTRSWATQAHMYDELFLPIKSVEELDRLKEKVYPQLDLRGRQAFTVFYTYKQDVLAGVLDESARG